MKTVSCLPRGICSWDFDLLGYGHQGVADFNWANESGMVLADGGSFRVEKQGMTSGRWVLKDGLESLYTAQKDSAFSRRIEIDGGGLNLVLEPQSWVSRVMNCRGQETDFTIAPMHCFTRRAKMRGKWTDFRLAAFAFWLSALMWRRSASNNS